MEKCIRVTLAASGVLALGCAVGCYVVTGWTQHVWPVPDAFALPRFFGAVAAAIGVSTLWIAVSGELGAMAGGTLTLMAFYTTLTVSLVILSQQDGAAGLSVGAVATGLASLLFATLFVRVRCYPIRDARPLPAPVRVAFVLYSALLAIVGLAILFRVANIFPLSLSPIGDASIGSFFVGAACYFVYALRRPVWGNAAGPMWAFLAYDAMLIVPFLLQFGHVGAGHLASLIVNTVVLVYSGALSVYYLLLQPAMRVLGIRSDRKWSAIATICTAPRGRSSHKAASGRTHSLHRYSVLGPANGRRRLPPLASRSR